MYKQKGCWLQVDIHKVFTGHEKHGISKMVIKVMNFNERTWIFFLKNAFPAVSLLQNRMHMQKYYLLSFLKHLMGFVFNLACRVN